MISFIAKILVALNGNSRPGELASGIAWGICLALIPAGNLLWPLLFITAFIIKHNLAAMFLSLLLFAGPAAALDPLLHKTGLFLLQMPLLQNFFTVLYNTPVLPWLKFNNTLIMGAFIWSLVLWLPLFICFHILIKLYKQKIAAKLAESKLIKTLKKVPWVSRILSAYQNIKIMV